MTKLDWGIMEEGCPAPLPHQPLQTEAPACSLCRLPKPLPLAAQSSQIHPPNIQDSCFPYCFHVHTLYCPCCGVTCLVGCLGQPTVLHYENLRKQGPYTNHLIPGQSAPSTSLHRDLTHRLGHWDSKPA